MLIKPALRFDIKILRPAQAAAVLLLAMMPMVTLAQDAVHGRWDPAFTLPNIAILTHLLSNGKVLFWGRRVVGNSDLLNIQDCEPFLLNPTTLQTETVPHPHFINSGQDGGTYNLFCSGHTFLADGRLLVVGGHILDGRGQPYATIYDPDANTWQPFSPQMTGGRWYPTAVTLADGSAFVTSGNEQTNHANFTQQIVRGGAFVNVANFDGAPPFYPRMHLASNGQLFMSGSLATSKYFNLASNSWTTIGDRPNGAREYGPSVM